MSISCGACIIFHFIISMSQKGQKGEPGQKGQKGDTGQKGQKGDQGDPGTSILTGIGVPDNSLGQDGDVYIDTSTDDLYTKIAGVWVLDTNLKGDKGDNGFSDVDSIGFSAYMDLASQISASGTLGNWTTSPIPYYESDDFNSTTYFDGVTGEYTVPDTGYYHVKFVFNYDMDTVPSSNLGSGTPYISLIRNTVDIARSPLPIIDVDIPSVLTMRSLLKTGSAVISANYRLGAGDVIAVAFNDDGETLPTLNIGTDKIITLFSAHRFA